MEPRENSSYSGESLDWETEDQIIESEGNVTLTKSNELADKSGPALKESQMKSFLSKLATGLTQSGESFRKGFEENFVK